METELPPYIVYMGTHSHGVNPTSDDLEKATKSHHTLLGSYLGSEEKAKDAIFYSYNRHINGFAAILDDIEAQEIQKHPNVVSVFLSKELKLHTTHSWEFLGLERNSGRVPSKSIWTKARFGEDVIIANLDSGVWPESTSFSEYEGIGPIPSKWRGIWQSVVKDKVRCNRKLIGARYFNKGYIALLKSINISTSENLFTSRDISGHGTHTLSTAAGSFVSGVNIFGNGNGTAKGGSPKARVAAYRVCWGEGNSCTEADTLAGFEAAISDGVDVISASIGGRPSEYFKESISIGSFHAVMKNIVVIASAGNDGSNSNTGLSLSLGGLPSQKFYPLIYGLDAKAAKVKDPLKAQLCETESLDPKKVKGKILVCLVGDESFTLDQGQEALLAGAVGMILVNNVSVGNHGFTAELHVLPTSHLNVTQGNYVLEYLKTTNESAPATTDLEFDKRRVKYNAASGTSMSCPHVSGIVGLLKNIHPDWSPAAIHSAIMTTAKVQDNNKGPLLDWNMTKATPFEYGSGHIQPNRAMDPGLVYDRTVNDYLNFLCAHGYNKTSLQLFYNKPFKCSKSFTLANLNYPSITVTDLSSKSVTVTRIVKNVGSPGTYKAYVKAPIGVYVYVKPTILEFTKVGEEKKFEVLFKPKFVGKPKDYVFGQLKWSDGKHYVRSPIVVKY
ncbi:hypothetical protein G4B88_016687 [Cannabis sativa]|uniref:Uncharacterized protein n=1 Tax=Cannabis sativa TaxID=3483 RepID=A0A7J6H7V9_CANSA|nr:hypothetical protein G4B88_016687 [Cannabis sativa]